MPRWELNIGNVDYYDEENRKIQNAELTITYDSDNYFSVTISRVSESEKTMQTNRNFQVCVLDETKGKTEICEDIYYLSSNQLEMLKTKSEYWEEKTPLPKLDPVSNKRPELHLGLVHHYNKDENDFFVSDVSIFKEEKEYRVVIKEYSKENNVTIMLKEIFFQSLSQVQFEYENQLIKCYISGDLFVINDSQKYLLNKFFMTWR